MEFPYSISEGYNYYNLGILENISKISMPIEKSCMQFHRDSTKVYL